MEYSLETASAYSDRRDEFSDTDTALLDELTAFSVADKTVVDIGCGDGIHTRHIANLGAARVIGADLSASMIGLAKDKSNQYSGLSYMIADGCHLPISTACVDLVISNYVLHYFPEASAIFNEISRVLKDDSYFIGTFNITDVEAGYEHLYNQFMPIRLGTGENPVRLENLMKSRQEIKQAIACASLCVEKERELDNRHSVVDDAFPFKAHITKRAIMMVLRRSQR